MKNFDSYILYIVFFSISIYWSRQYDIKKQSVISQRTKLLYGVLITLPIIILQGLRYDVGTDYFNYLSLYKGFSQGNKVFLKWYQSEPLFILLCRILYATTQGSNIAFFLFNAILMNVLLFLTFDYYKDQVNLPMMYFFYYMLCFPEFLNLERQGLAVIIIWYATKYIHEKKPGRFLCCVLIATLFHNTAIIGISFYLVELFRGKYGRYIKKILIALMICSPFLLKPTINFMSKQWSFFQRYNKFLRTDTISTIEYFTSTFLFFLLMLIIVWTFNIILKKSRIDFLWILFLWIAQLASYLLSNYIEWGFRMSFYFEFGIMFAYSFVCTRLERQGNKIIFNIFAFLMLLFYFTYKSYIQQYGEIIPYHFIGFV